jgi:geranylgeranyl pyrophosphate synthase
MIHCFTLIHDDLPCMDDDDERRGRPSNHIKFGDATALLAGDALIPAALMALWDAAPALGPERADAFAKGYGRFLQATGALGVVGGQALELECNPAPSLEVLLQIHQLKTGALFEAALLTPLDFSAISANDPRAEVLTEFAQALGLAFQIADDLEDLPELSGILAFMTPREAQNYALETLQAKTAALTALGRDPVLPLIELANEVQKKIRGAIHGT